MWKQAAKKGFKYGAFLGILLSPIGLLVGVGAPDPASYYAGLFFQPIGVVLNSVYRITSPIVGLLPYNIWILRLETLLLGALGVGIYGALLNGINEYGDRNKWDAGRKIGCVLIALLALIVLSYTWVSIFGQPTFA